MNDMLVNIWRSALWWIIDFYLSIIFLVSATSLTFLIFLNSLTTFHHHIFIKTFMIFLLTCIVLVIIHYTLIFSWLRPGESVLRWNIVTINLISFTHCLAPWYDWIHNNTIAMLLKINYQLLVKVAQTDLIFVIKSGNDVGFNLETSDLTLNSNFR